MTPSDWLARNLTQVVVALAQAGATLAGSGSELSQTANAHPQTGSQDE